MVKRSQFSHNDAAAQKLLYHHVSVVPVIHKLVFNGFVCYLGDGVFWEVLVGEVTGLDQLAGDRGVWRVRGLPMGACEQS